MHPFNTFSHTNTSTHPLIHFRVYKGSGASTSTSALRGLIGVAGASNGNLYVKAYTPTAAPSVMPTFVYDYIWYVLCAGRCSYTRTLSTYPNNSP